MSKLALLSLFACGLLADVANATPITLSCSGSLWIQGAKVPEMEKTDYLIIDIDQKTVTGSLGEFSIIEISNTEVVFKAPFEEPGEQPGMKLGRVDRVSGTGKLTAMRGMLLLPAWIYDFTCKRADPVF
jgi:hypothetical protein